MLVFKRLFNQAHDFRLISRYAMSNKSKELQHQEEQEIIIKEETSLAKGKEQMLKSTLPEQEIQTHQKSDEQYVVDYTQTPTKTDIKEIDENLFVASLRGADGIEWKKNTPQKLDMRSNSLAMQVLSAGEIDLADERIQVTSLRVDKSLGESTTGMKEIDLGRVEVLAKNSINLRDVDVHNIPDDIDIQLDERYRELRAVGVEATEDVVQRQIIEDVSLQDFKDKHLFGFEQPWLVLDKVEVLRKTIRRLPAYMVFFAFFSTFMEVYHLSEEVSRMEDQEWKPQREYLESAQKQLMHSDERFNRARVLQQ